MTQSGLLETAFAVEEYVCAGSKKLIEKMNENDLSELPWIEYPGMVELFDLWREKQFPRKKKLNAHQLKFTGKINSLHGAIEMLAAGKGLTIVPKHVVGNEIAARKISFWNGNEVKKVESPIFIVTLMDVVQPKRVEYAIGEFLLMKSKKA